ncbi:MAG: hypothetical protein Q8M92_10815, partial [Candidatus Subteraquimicrobiales bacterium]|nr:hypothetical protein [Candidatus Subteraquimicrobiales bacterium]
MLDLHLDIFHSLVMSVVFTVWLSVGYASWHKYVKTQDSFWIYFALTSVIFSIYFFLQALVVPDFTIYYTDALFDIFEHYGLFLGSIVLLIGVISGKVRKWLVWVLLAISFLQVVFLVMHPSFQEFLYQTISYPTALSGVVFFLMSVMFGRRYYQTRNHINLYMMLGIGLLVATAVIPFYYTKWGFLWWLNHGIFLFAGAIILLGIIIEKLREKKSESDLKIPFYKKMSFRLTTLFLFVVVVPLTLLGIYSFYISQKALGKQ